MGIICKNQRFLHPLRSEETEKQVFNLSCPGLRYASHIAQPVSAVRTQAVVFSLRSDPTWGCNVTGISETKTEVYRFNI